MTAEDDLQRRIRVRLEAELARLRVILKGYEHLDAYLVGTRPAEHIRIEGVDNWRRSSMLWPAPGTPTRYGFTLQDTLDDLASDLPEQATQLALEIRGAVAQALPDAPDLVPAVLAVAELVNRWPLWWYHQRGPILVNLTTYGVLNGVLGLKAPETELMIAVWARQREITWAPPNVTPAELGRWAHERRLLTPDLVAMIVEGRFTVPSEIGVLWDVIRRVEAVHPAPWGLMKVPTGTVSVGTLVALTDPQTTIADAALLHETEDDGTQTAVLEWDGNRLELPFTDGAVGVLVELGRRYGPTYTRDGIVLLAHAQAAGVSASQAFWCWPNEALALAGLKPTNENQRAWWARLEMLHQAQLVVHRGGRTVRAPVVQEVAHGGTRGGSVPVQLLWHPAIYEDICNEDGTPGGRWWTVPLRLLQLDAKTPHHAAALVLSRQLRATYKPKQGAVPAVLSRISVERLVDQLRIPLESDRKVQHKAAAQITSILDGLREAGVLGSWSHGDGQLDQLQGVITFTAGEAALDAIQGRMPRPPRFVPATGADLRRWLDVSGLTAEAAGDLLGVSGARFRQWLSRYRSAPLPDPVRALLVALLRPSVA